MSAEDEEKGAAAWLSRRNSLREIWGGGAAPVLLMPPAGGYAPLPGPSAPFRYALFLEGGGLDALVQPGQRTTFQPDPADRVDALILGVDFSCPVSKPAIELSGLDASFLMVRTAVENRWAVPNLYRSIPKFPGLYPGKLLFSLLATVTAAPVDVDGGPVRFAAALVLVKGEDVRW